MPKIVGVTLATGGSTILESLDTEPCTGTAARIAKSPTLMVTDIFTNSAKNNLHSLENVVYFM